MTDYGENDNSTIKEILSEAARYYYNALQSETGKIAREYATERQLTGDTIVKFGIGYAPDGFNNLYRYLNNKGFSESDLKKCGLFTASKNGKMLDLFRARLMIPIIDPFGHVIAFGGRNIGAGEPKYLNSPDSLVYKKKENLYALNIAKLAKSRQLIIVEGYMDAITMHQAGLDNVVATLGTAFTDEQLRLATKYAKELVFFFDSDSAGKRASLRAIFKMRERLTGPSAIRVRIANVPEGKDPDEHIKLYGSDSIKEFVKRAPDVQDYLFDRAYDDNYDQKLGLDEYGFEEDIIEYGSWIQDSKKRESLAVKAAECLKVSKDTILRVINERLNDLY